MKKYIMWVNHGLEGWSPWEFDTLEEMTQHIQAEGVYSAFVVTERLTLSVAKGDK